MRSIEKIDAKISKIDAEVSEFRQIKHTAKVIGWIAGIAMTLLLTVAAYMAKEAWSIFKPIAVASAQQQASKP